MHWRVAEARPSWGGGEERECAKPEPEPGKVPDSSGSAETEVVRSNGAGERACAECRAPGESTFSDGTRVTPETARRLACCSPVTEITCHEDLIRAMESRSRRVPERLWTALLLRDRGCRFPGYRCRMNLVPHHIRHWADGGRTEYWNLVLLCPIHHRAVREEGFEVQLHRSGEAMFRDRAGMPIPPCAPPPMLEDPIERLREQHRAKLCAKGTDPDVPQPYRGVRSGRDLPPGMLRGAMEALGEPGAGEGGTKGGEQGRG